MMPWINARVLHHLDMALLHRTRGHCALPALLAGLPLITLTTIGARSGRRRSSPLVGLPDGENIVVVASNFGERRHPGWYHNLRANPTATISAGGREGRFTAREATPAERDRLWRMGDAIYRGYAAYRRRAGGRSIPILILVPVAA
jgi:deazaflavin-dependent oxidoreductase (nitroreductase family)